MRRFFRTLRVAIFGATRPARWFRDYVRSGAEEIDPQRADPRAVVPEEPGREDEHGRSTRE